MKDLLILLKENGLEPATILVAVFLVVIYRVMVKSSSNLNNQIVGEFKKTSEATSKVINEHKLYVNARFTEYRAEDTKWREKTDDGIDDIKNEQKSIVENQELMQKKYDELKMYDDMRKRMYANSDVRFVKTTKQEYITKMFNDFERGLLSWDIDGDYTKDMVYEYYQEVSAAISSEFIEKYRKFGFESNALSVIKSVDSFLSSLAWNMVDDIINTFIDKDRYNGARDEIVRAKIDTYMSQYINKWNQIFDEYTHIQPDGSDR